MLRLARSINRVFLYTWLPQIDLIQFIEPNLINWTVTDSVSMLPRETFNTYDNRENLTHYQLSKLSRDKVIYVNLKMSRGAVEFPYLINDYAVTIQSLFKPSAAMTQTVDAELKSLMIDSTQAFVSVHLRMLYSVNHTGTMTHDNDAHFTPTDDHLIVVKKLLECGKDLSSIFFNRSNNAIVIITDSLQMKHFLLENQKNISINFVVSHQQPVHISHAKSQADTLSTFVDMFLLARSSCVVHVVGGFSKIATKFGNDCLLDGVPQCQQFQQAYQISHV